MARKKKRNAKVLMTLDEFLDEEGTRETFQTIAIKEVRSWQTEQITKDCG